jgi:light-regulated signal transduction histidine kinase (bacteriophytochrome)
VVAEGDHRLLRIVFENLLGNAWKFSGDVADAVVEFGVCQTNGLSTYFVRDNGAGFDMAYTERLFTPFQRLHLQSRFPGTGIGLATVHRIVDRHGGRVWAESAVDHGATFLWTLPALKSGSLT